MTIYDCQKLKTLLEMEVAALKAKLPKIPRSSSIKGWQTILLIVVYIFILLVVGLIFCVYKSSGGRPRRSNDEEKMSKQETIAETDEKKGKNAPLNTPGTSTGMAPQHSETSVGNMKIISKEILASWIRRKAGPYFVHNESTLRRQQIKSREIERLREASTQQNVEKWTKMREKLAEKAKEKSLQAEQKGKGKAKK